MKNIHVKCSYNIWNYHTMKNLIRNECIKQYHQVNAVYVLNRSYLSMYVEWYLHNIGYWITKPFISIRWFRKINIRCRDVDLQEY